MIIIVARCIVIIKIIEQNLIKFIAPSDEFLNEPSIGSID